MSKEAYTKTKQTFKNKKTFNLSSYYKYYTLTTAKKDQVTKEMYNEIVTSFFEYVKDDLINGFRVALPNNIGQLLFIRFDIKKRFVDWGETNKMKQYLIENDLPLYDKDTGKGNKYIMYSDQSSAFKLQWMKRKVFMSKMYKIKIFRPLKKEMIRNIHANPLFLNNFQNSTF